MCSQTSEGVNDEHLEVFSPEKRKKALTDLLQHKEDEMKTPCGDRGAYFSNIMGNWGQSELLHWGRFNNVSSSIFISCLSSFPQCSAGVSVQNLGAVGPGCRSVF